MGSNIRPEHDWWKSLSRDKDQASWLFNTIQRSANSPSVHDFTAPRFPQPLPGQKFSNTKRSSEFTRIERQSREIPFHTAPRTQLKSSRNKRGTFSRGTRRELTRPSTTMGPYSIMDPEDLAFDETCGIVWSNAPLVSHSDASIRKATPGPGKYGVPDERLCTSTSKRPVSLSMSRGKKPLTPLDWVIKRAKNLPSPHSYNLPPPPKIHGGKLQDVVPTYLDHIIRRSKTEPGPFEYNVDQKIDKGRRFGKTNTLNWAEKAIRDSRRTPSVHQYSFPSSIRTNLGTPFRVRDDGTGAFDRIISTASQLPSCYDYSPNFNQGRPKSTHIRGPGQAMTTAKRVTDVDILIKARSATPGPRRVPRVNRKGAALLAVCGPPFLRNPRDLNDELMRKEAKKPGPTTYDVVDDDDYFRQKNYGGAWGTAKKMNLFDAQVKLENKQNFLSSSVKKKRRRKRLLQIKKERYRSLPKRGQKISVSCRCMGQTVRGIKIKAGLKENMLLELLKSKMMPKVKTFVSSDVFDTFVLVKPYKLLENTSLEIAPPPMYNYSVD